MDTTYRPGSPSWFLLCVASLMIGPAVIAAWFFGTEFVQSDRWKSIPEFPSISDPPALQPRGLIAYVHQEPRDHSEVAHGCVFVVQADGTTPPRRVGCPGDGVVPKAIVGIYWTEQGDLVVRARQPRPTPITIRLGAGRPAPGSIPEQQRVQGYKEDGTLVRLADRTEDLAELAIERPRGGARIIASFDGPNSYHFGEPQWSPDGQWILVTDTEGRMLISSPEGDVRELLPADPAREWLGYPFLTWQQGVDQ